MNIGQFAVMGHSGGGPHALACSALLKERVVGAVCVAGPAPFQAEGLDWFAGMGAFGTGELHAAAEGRAGLEDYLAANEFAMDQSLRQITRLSTVNGRGWPTSRRKAPQPAWMECWMTNWQ